MWLTYSYMFPWLMLSLSQSDQPPRKCNVTYVSNQIPTDPRHICSAWIYSGQKECVCKLTGGITDPHTAHCLFYNEMFVRHKDLFDKSSRLLCDDQLTIVCEVHVFTNNVRYVDNWLFDPLKPATVHNTEHTLGSDFKRILDTGENSDVALVASDGKEFPAHTLILSIRSNVFAAMFKQEMKEKQEKRVNIDDLSSKVVQSLLEFIYTDKVPDIATLAPELLSAGHKYNIPRLMLLCEEIMASDLNTENAAEYFLLADLYGASQLRKIAKHFTTTHLKKVKGTDGWMKLMVRAPHAVDEILNEMADLMAQLTSS